MEKYCIVIESTGKRAEAEAVALTTQQMLLNHGHIVQSTKVSEGVTEILQSRTMRAKFIVSNVEPMADSEIVTFDAAAKNSLYPEDGRDEDNSFALWTPSATLKMTIRNPALRGTFEVGQKYYSDFSPALV